MKNTNRQHALDKQKWIESESQHLDMSGKMPYCDFCAECNNDNTCNVSQIVRASECLCARAFNRMKRRKVIDK